MQKGISPIVAVVLLIAIAVIAAVGLYFWVGGLATKQPTPNTPAIMSAQGLTCGTGVNNVTVMVQNLAASTAITAANLTMIADNGTCSSGSTTITAGQQVAVTFNCTDSYAHTAGSTYVILGPVGTSQATFVCP